MQGTTTTNLKNQEFFAAGTALDLILKRQSLGTVGLSSTK